MSVPAGPRPSTGSEAQELVRQRYFVAALPRLGRLAARCCDDPDAVVAEAAVAFDGMLPGMAYLDRPHHPLAPALFICSVNLALYLALKRRGVDVHDFGSALLAGVARAPRPPTPPAVSGEERDAWFAAAAAESQARAGSGEDVIEFVPGGAGFVWGYDVTSCAICSAAARYDAAEVVPYMCAVDDVMSDRLSQGLRRTGSIALGAERCDFRFQPGSPQRLADRYPERIRLPVLGS